MTEPSRTTDPNLAWGDDGLPRSGLYGDVYFSAEDGLAESRAVFLAGADLPEAWRRRPTFTVGELGFGTGLNIAALLDLWSRTKPPGGRLRIFSIEGHPIAREDAARALARWPELAPVADALIAAWPRRARGFHRVDLPGFDATLDLAVMDAAEALARWDGRADAWFLDGFSPATNPAMWSQPVLDLVAARSAPGAVAATFTVAGAVRRGLQAAGFAVDKRPGFGRKRERLEARLPGVAASPSSPKTVAVIGAGIAGAALARAFRDLGAEVTVFDPRGSGGGASGNPAALVTPRLDAGLGPAAALYAQGFARAVDAYGTLPDATIARTALQLAESERDPRRFAAVTASDLFEPGALTLEDAAAVSARLGEPAPGGLAFEDALVVEPARILAAWAGESRREAVARLEHGDEGWRLIGDAGETLLTAEVVCIASGHRSPALSGLPLQSIRGQASWTDAVQVPVAVSYGAYAVPTRTGTLFGATFDRDQDDETVSAADHDRNLALAAKGLPALAARLAEAPLKGRAAVRAATADRLPLAGPVPDSPAGLFVLSGLGSRGFTMAPLLAEHVAAIAMGEASPLPSDLATIVAPARFALRARRRTSS